MTAWPSTASKRSQSVAARGRGPLGPRLLQDAAHARGAHRLCCFARGSRSGAAGSPLVPCKGVASGIVALQSAESTAGKCSITSFGRRRSAGRPGAL